MIVKPDGYVRGLTGRIVARIEQSGLRVLASRVSYREGEVLTQHYRSDAEWLAGVGQSVIDDCRDRGVSPERLFGGSDALDVGEIFRDRLLRFMASGPVFVAVLSGENAIATTRRLIGHTIPSKASPGTIRGDYSNDSIARAISEVRCVQNVVHASSSASEASREIRLWFPALPELPPR